jgi:hypothetical protein
MSDNEQRGGGVLGGLPATRPQRRSGRRATGPGLPSATRAATATRTSAGAREPATAAPRRSTPRLAQPAQPAGTPRALRRRPPAQRPDGLVGTAVQAAGELAQIGLTVGGQVVRGALSRLPKP